MSRRSPTRNDREETASPEFTRLLLLAIGVAMLIGLICGVVWVAYNLVRHWFA